MNKNSLAVTLIAATTCNQTFSNEQPIAEDNILVTATRTAQSIDDTLAAVSFFDSQQITRLQPYDLLSLLSQTPGVDVARTGSRGSKSSLYLRGTNDGHALVLVDGVRLGSATLGAVSLQHIDPQQIERIEVVRGPRSSLYGSEALGGVVQIFMKKSGEEFKPTLKFGFGNDSTYESTFGLGGKLGKTSIDFNASHLESEGIDSQIFDGNTDSDGDAYRNSTVTASVEHNWDSGAELSLSYYLSKGQNEFDQGNSFFAVANSAPYSAFKVESINATYSLPVTASWTSSFSVGSSADESKTRDDNIVKIDEFNTRRDQASWQNDIQLNESYLLTLGYDYYEDEVDGSQTYMEDHRSNRALFTQVQGQLSERLDVVVGHRRDDNEQFGYKTTYNAAVGFDLDDSHRLIVSRGTAFKAPTFNDLYWPADPWSAGNPDLEPEESINIDVELRGKYEGLSWSVTAYKNEIENLIEWAETSPFFWQPSNVSEAEIEGVELSLATEILGWQLNSVASYVDPEDASTGNTLARRAQRSVSVRVDRDFGSLSLGIDWKAQSHRFDEAANTTRLSGYGVVGVRIGYLLSPKLKAHFKVDNVFDKDYQLNADYHTEGTAAFLSMTYSM